MKATAADQEDEVERFVRLASHDLSEPLRAIAGFADLLDRRYRDRLDDDGALFLDHLRAGCGRLQAQLDGLLELSRVGRWGPDPEPVDLGRLVDEAARAHPALVVERDALPTVVGRPHDLELLIGHLVDNAARFGASRVAVVADPLPGDDGVELEVADDGPGIPADRRAAVLEPFVRVHDLERAGAGLGLAICAKVAQTSGGSIEVDASPLGGSLVRVTLPRKAAP